MHQEIDPGGSLIAWPKSRTNYTGAIYRLRKTPAQSIGTVEAADEAEAIRRAIEQFHIEPARAGRLIARRAS
jgi:hypothetical protein